MKINTYYFIFLYLFMGMIIIINLCARILKKYYEKNKRIFKSN